MHIVALRAKEIYAGDEISVADSKRGKRQREPDEDYMNLPLKKRPLKCDVQAMEPPEAVEPYNAKPLKQRRLRARGPTKN